MTHTTGGHRRPAAVLGYPIGLSPIGYPAGLSPAELRDKRQPNAQASTPDTPTPERKVPTMPDNFRSKLMAQVGLLPTATDPEFLAALDQALDERADPSSAPIPPAPDGYVNLTAAEHRQLLIDANQGHQVLLDKVAGRRTAAVEAAVQDGRIPPAQRGSWISALKADPAMTAVLDELKPGAVPLVAKGYTGGVDESSDDETVLFRRISAQTSGGR